MRKILVLVLALSCIGPTSALAQSAKHGQLRQHQSATQVWDEQAAKWVDVESFWLSFASGHGSRYWGKSDRYPEYGQVKQTDTVLIELAQGTCLMEFWHSRWRRANDVRRWDDGFNAYGGCPFVFD